MKTRCAQSLCAVATLLLAFGAAPLPAQTPPAQPTAAPSPAATIPPANLSGPTREVLRLVQSKADDNAVMAYVTITPERFQLDSAGIRYLHSQGVPRRVIMAMLNHLSQTGPEPTAYDNPGYASTGPAPVFATPPANNNYSGGPYYYPAYSRYYVPGLSLSFGAGYRFGNYGYGSGGHHHH